MTPDVALDTLIAGALGRTHAALCGRGTTALWLALRTIRRRDGPGEVIVPDILCATALEGVLLAGFVPVFADVIPGRYTLDPACVAERVTPRTRAILVAHLYGHIADIAALRRAAPGVPILEDAVQGIGGRAGNRPAGALGDLAFISFDRHKLIGGRGGLLLWDDAALTPGILADLRCLPALPTLDLSVVHALLPAEAAATYAAQLRTARAPALLRTLDPAPANLARIWADWETLGERIAQRNAKGRWLAAQLAGQPLMLPEVRAGDALWCYTVQTSNRAIAARMIRALQGAGVSATRLYPPLSRWFGAAGAGTGSAGRLVNLWVDPATDDTQLQRAVEVIAGLPWARMIGG